MPPSDAKASTKIFKHVAKTIKARLVWACSAADTTDPAKAKFYGDVQEKLTTISTDLVFFKG